MNHNYIHGGTWLNTQKIQLFDDLHPLQSILQVYQTKSNKVWHIMALFFCSWERLAAQVPLDLKKA